METNELKTRNELPEDIKKALQDAIISDGKKRFSTILFPENTEVAKKVLSHVKSNYLFCITGLEGKATELKDMSPMTSERTVSLLTEFNKELTCIHAWINNEIVELGFDPEDRT